MLMYASDNVISGNDPSSDILTSQTEPWNEQKAMKQNNVDLVRLLETRAIWAFDTGFPNIFYKYYCQVCNIYVEHDPIFHF